ncbi:MAG: hypothetical protein ABSF83_06625 [Nitrososphaerales archaeon]|jgi:hypothetical protein
MDAETAGAIGLNLAAYASLAAALLQWGRQRPPRPTDGPAAFRLLERALRRSFPDLPRGFTLKEGLSKARLDGPALRWEEIDRTVADYEAFRYGDGPAPSLPQPELMRLVKVLWRRRR